MATKVLEVDLENLPTELAGLERFNTVLFLVRFRSQPVARLELRVRNGRIKGLELREAVSAGLTPDLLRVWLDFVLGQAPPLSAKPLDRFVTVAVCTRDRPDDLQKCLRSLECLPDDGQEILVVDNCSRTDAVKTLARTARRCRYLREDRPGLNRARNRALREARGSVVAFTDDDTVADPGWLRALCSPLNDPLTLAVTGLTMPSELETEAQETFERLSGFCRGFRRRRFQLETLEPAAAGAAGAGANMALHRGVLEKVGPFDEALDAGTPTRSGGDSELFSRILIKGYEIVYEPGALNWHRHRRTWPELRETMFGYGLGLYAAWTRSLLVEREWSVLRAARRWFLKEQLPKAIRSLCGRPGAGPADLILAELAGSALGAWAYGRSRWQSRSL